MSQQLFQEEVKEALLSRDSSASLRVEALKSHRNSEKKLTFQRPTETGSGQVRHCTNHLLPWAQLCKNRPSCLASPSEDRSWAPDPRGGDLQHLKSGKGKSTQAPKQLLDTLRVT